MYVKDAVLLRLFQKNPISYIKEKSRLRCLWTAEPMTIHDSIMESIPYRFQIRGNVMVKLRLKRCGRKQRAT